MSFTRADDFLITPGASHGADLVAVAVKYLRQSDEEGLTAELQRNWSTERLVALLSSNNQDAVKIAAVCLGLVGTLDCCPALAAALHHGDSVVVSVTEIALWQVWFRSGPSDACREVHDAAALMEAGRYSEATCVLDNVISEAPDYAEAYNQRAIAHYLTDRCVDAIADCKRALRLNPTHFAALAGMGHCLAHLGRFSEALIAYQGALELHPRMEGIRQSIRQVRTILGCPNQLRSS